MNKLINFKYRALFSLIAMLLLTGSLFAQPGHNRNHPPKLPDDKQIEKMVDELAETIKLNEDQKSEISQIFVAHFAKAKKLMKANKGNRENQRKAMDALKDQFEEDVKALLNDEQKTGFEKFWPNEITNQGKSARR